MNPDEEIAVYREQLKNARKRKKLHTTDYRRIDKFAARLMRRVRGAKFGEHDPLLPDEGVI